MSCPKAGLPCAGVAIGWPRVGLVMPSSDYEVDVSWTDLVCYACHGLSCPTAALDKDCVVLSISWVWLFVGRDVTRRGLCGVVNTLDRT
jgi:hypothetical protein